MRMGLVSARNQRTIEEDLLTFRRRYTVFLPIFQEVTFVPFKAIPLCGIVYVKHIRSIWQQYTFVKPRFPSTARGLTDRRFAVAPSNAPKTSGQLIHSIHLSLPCAASSSA